MQLEGRLAVVTGAGRRLGRAIALALADGGAELVLHVHTSSRLGKAVAQEIRQRGGRATVLQADLSCAAETQQLCEQALRIRGRVDILVNNAAVFYPTPIETLTTAAWHNLLRTNLTSAFSLGLFFGQAMRQHGAGKIIQLGDWSGLRPSPDYLAYCVSKGGVHALSVAFAKAFAPEVQVNTVAPGPVYPPSAYDTSALRRLEQETPLGRLGSPQDVARAVCFLIEQGDFITGASYVVDGGWLSRGPGGRTTSL
jgi:pteridine reductase